MLRRLAEWITHRDLHERQVKALEDLAEILMQAAPLLVRTIPPPQLSQDEPELLNQSDEDYKSLYLEELEKRRVLGPASDLQEAP